MADLGEEAFSSQMKVVTTFLRLLEELMGGMLRVNDRVKVIQPNDGSLGGDGFTVIADSVRIAALDGNFSSGSGSSDGYSTVTLEVTPEQAGKIRTAGGLTLTLPSSADTTESGE